MLQGFGGVGIMERRETTCCLTISGSDLKKDVYLDTLPGLFATCRLLLLVPWTYEILERGSAS
jgi:hypothetical protein